MLDAERRVVACNAAAGRLLGREPATLVGTPAAALFAAEDVEDALIELEHALADVAAADERAVWAHGQQPGQRSMRLRSAHGSPVVVELTWAPLEHPQLPGGAVGIGPARSHQRRLEHELAQTVESFRALAEVSKLGLYRLQLHPTVRFEELSATLIEVAGLDPRDAIGDARAIAARLSPEVLQTLQRGRADPDAVTWPVEGCWQHTDGTPRDVEITEVPILDDDGRVVAVMGLVRDLTAARREQAAVAEALRLEQDATERLRHLDDLRRVFLRAVSHELRTPLTSVLGFTDTLRRHAARLSPEEVAEIIARTHGQAQRVHRLLDDLLDVDRLSQGIVELIRVEVGLAPLVTRALGDAGLVATLDLDEVRAPVDAPKLERVVVNLVANARRYAGSHAEVVVRLRKDAGWAVIEVSDDGPGVPVALREKVFEAFAQGRQAASSHAPGTGIGLTLVAEFVRLHGGTVRIDDSELGGARVTVRLPLDPVVDPVVDPTTS